MRAGAPGAGLLAAPASFDDEAVAARAERHADLQRGERILTRIRYAGVAFALLQTFAYRPPPDIALPGYVRPAGLVIAVLLALGTTVAWLVSQRVATLEGARSLALATLSMDVLTVAGFVWLWSFDPISALWAILFVPPLEGAMRFQMRGALGAWAVATVLYIGREFYAAGQYGFAVEPESISFRMGLNLLIALFAGSMASDLVSQRARVAESLRQLGRIDVLRRHLVSTLAHDVRGPLTTIRGAVNTLLERPDITPEVRERLLQAAQRQAGRLQYLAADLLDLARLEQGRLELDLRPVNLLAAVRESSSYTDHDQQYDLAIDPGVHVWADPHRLEQVVVNLTANALRYGAPPYEVRAAREGDRVKVLFQDHGPGVPESKREQLFEPFSSTDETPGSVGLGLWICWTLLDAQAGELSYRYELDSGPVFEVVLQAADPDADAAAGSTRHAQAQ